MGIVTGLAWTEMGGELLTTEATVMPGKGKLIITGKLGEVMQESAQAAMSYVRSRAERFGIDKKFVREQRHPHPPARGRHPEGRPVRGRHHGDRAGLGADQDPGAPRRGDDRRDHPARPGAAHRRPEGEDARRPPRRHQDRPHPQGEPEGPAGDPEEDPRASCASSRWSTWTRCSARRWCWRSRRSSSASPSPEPEQVPTAVPPASA